MPNALRARNAKALEPLLHERGDPFSSLARSKCAQHASQTYQFL